MLVMVSSWVRRAVHWLRRLAAEEQAVAAAVGMGYALGGFLLSAASLGNSPQPLPLAVLCALEPGWPMVLLALGSAGGYLVFWGQAGFQGLAWTVSGLAVSGLLALEPNFRRSCLLPPALAGMVTAVWGTVFRLGLWEQTALSIYLLRIGLAALGAWVCRRGVEGHDPVAKWVCQGAAVLALAQAAPFGWLNLGCLAAAALAARCPFPAAALAGAALDLAKVTPIPMTAVLCLAWLVRMIPRLGNRWGWAAPAALCLPVAALCGVWDWRMVPGLAIGGALSLALPGRQAAAPRRGSLGLVQVRLELAAGVLAQAEQAVLEMPEGGIDCRALMQGAAERACGGCACRSACRGRERLEELDGSVLLGELPRPETLNPDCRRPGRLGAELRRSQEQLRHIRGEHRRREECRQAVVQQYRFLSEYLQSLSDTLAQPAGRRQQRYTPEIGACTAGREAANGDKCCWFPGAGLRYYVLLCDGMGTGLGAAEDGQQAVQTLRQLLQAGFPAEHALESFNSLCALTGRAGTVCVDLLELELDTGRAAVYKWGAAPSYLVSGGTAQRIGTASPPPGLSVHGGRAAVNRLSLGRGGTLVLLSDGAGGEEALRRAGERWSDPPGELADRILEYGRAAGADDATAAVVRLRLQTTGG